MNKVKVGIVGCGAIHSTHCRALAEIENAELAGVYDIVPERAQEAAATFNTTAYATLPELFNAVDSVTVCTPGGLHAEVGLQAAKAGKHVLCEKPIDIHLDKAERLIKECRSRGLKLGVISQHRFAPGVREVKEMLEKGALGKVLHCDVHNKWYRTQGYYDSGDWRGTRELDGGCMMNQGIHYIDLGQWLMGGVQNVQCRAFTLAHDMECEDAAYAFIEYKNGAIGLLQVATTCYPGFAERVEICGTIGSVVIEGDKITFTDIDPNAAESGFYGKGVTAHPVPPAQPNSAAANPLSLWDILHREQIEDFVNAILEDRDPFVTGEEAIKPVQEILACYESAANKGAIVEPKELAAAGR